MNTITTAARDAQYQFWLHESLERVAQAGESGDPQVLEAARQAYWELATAIEQMEQEPA